MDKNAVFPIILDFLLPANKNSNVLVSVDFLQFSFSLLACLSGANVMMSFKYI